MNQTVPNRSQAFDLLTEYNRSESLIRHALAVEAVMLHFARLLGEKDPGKWGIIGLIHDLDYEKYPEQHCRKTAEILAERGWPEDWIHAVESHGWGIASDVEPILPMEKVLYTVDELTGLIAAAALVRPSRSILDMEPKSVKKKWKEKSFAAGVNRELIEQGAKSLGMELDDVVRETLEGMREIAGNIGLAGEPQHGSGM